VGFSESPLFAVIDKCGPADLTIQMDLVQSMTVQRAFGRLPGPNSRAGFSADRRLSA